MARPQAIRYKPDVQRLLAIDVGNTNTVFGLWCDANLLGYWRIETNQHRTADEMWAWLSTVVTLSGHAPSFTHAIVASVVPTTQFGLRTLCEERLKIQLLSVGPGIKTGMPILYENPREVGADRIVNAVAAYEKLRQGAIIVDFGTATTWDVVTDKGEYLGGAIAPGIHISADALYKHASKLPRVELTNPGSAIGRNTVASMQSGMVFGYAGLVDGVVDKIRSEVGFSCRCIATGGLASLIAAQSRTIEEVDELLTLRGLKLLFDRNL